MKSRKLYYRRKGKSIVVEGKIKGQSVLIWTLPDPEKFINEIMLKSSYFSIEKSQKIIDILSRLDIREEKKNKQDSKVPTINITRTPKKDANQSPETSIREDEAEPQSVIPLDKKHIPTEEEKKLMFELSKE